MRRHTLLTAIVAIVLVASIALGAGKGAVKSPLVAVVGEGSGWVVANINANDVIIVTMHIEDGVPGAVQDILVWTPYGAELVNPFIMLNPAGNGTAQIQVQLTIPDGVDVVPVWVDSWGGSGILQTDPIPVPVPTK